MLLSRLCFALILLSGTILNAHAQVASNPLNPSTIYGPQPFTSSTSDTETVNNANGDVTVSVPLLHLPGVNGLDLNLNLLYDSKLYDLMQQESGSGESLNASLYWYPTHSNGALSIPSISVAVETISISSIPEQPGVPPGTQQIICNAGWVYTDENGTPHSFNNQQGCFYETTYEPLAAAPREYVNISDARDSSFLQLDTTNPSDIKLLKPNGDIVHFALTSTGGVVGYLGSPSNSGFPTSIVDPNGNTIAINAPTGSTTTTITDSLGRAITITQTAISNPINYSITYTDGNGAARTITASSVSAVTADVTLEASECQGPTAPDGHAVIPATINADLGTTGTQTTISIPSGPGNQTQKYILLLDAAGELNAITYPSGGTTSYTYASVPGSYHQGQFSCAIYGVREVLQKSQCRSATGSCTSNDVTTYGPTFSNNQNTKTNATMTVFLPPDAQGQQTKTVYSYSAVVGPWEGPFETSRSVYSNGTNPIETVTTTYTNGPASNPPPAVTVGNYGLWALPQTVTTTLYTASGAQIAAQTGYTYPSMTLSATVYNNETNSYYFPTPQTVTESDYNQNTLKTTTTQLKTGGNYGVTAGHILDRVQSVTVSDGSITSTKNYGYDTIGNLISASTGGTNAQTETVSYSNNSYGQVQTVTDPAGNTTTYSYTNAWSDTSCPVTKTTASSPASVTNALGQVTAYLYYSCSGQLSNATDSNGQTTRYVYDAISRITGITYPDQGSLTYSYVDAAPTSVEVIRLLSTQPSTMTYSTKAVLDGLGRVSQNQVESDPQGTDFTDITYDALGHKNSVSNPYRSSSDPTYGITSYLYDALGREISECAQDNSATPTTTCSPANDYQQWTYSGAAVTYRNNNGTNWQRSYDALGRLVQVLEPNSSGGLSLETDYKYDALSDLMHVDQWGGPSGSSGDRGRTFTYDGLARLLTATNAETGTVTYSYYTNGGSLCSGDSSSVCSKVDARGVVTNYAYSDALNRLTSKSYSNDPANTPSVSYAYDVAASGWSFPNQTFPALANTQQANLIGRLSSEKNSNSTMVFGYDPMGRTVLKSTCTPLTCSASDHFDQHYQYDLAGDMKFSDLGLDAVRNAATANAGYYYGGLTMVYGGAAKLITGTADIVDATHPASIVSGLQYSPLGGVTSLQLGSVYGEGDSYTPRGWPQQRYGIDVVNGLQHSGTLSHDNVGNVTQLVDSANGTTQYSYDQLNRLTSFSNPYAGANYGFDNWGNMTTHTQTVGTGYSFSLNYNTKNQTMQAGSTNGGLTYDAAGDVLFDGLNNYSYDGEGRLLSVNAATTYLYGPDGTRVATAQGGSVTAEYLYDSSNTLVTTLGTDGKMVRGSLYGGGMHLADYTAGTGAGGGQTEFRFMDEVNSLAIKLDQAGNILESCYQNPFGESLNCNGPTGTSSATDFTETHFTDKKRDAESGLDYFGARYYGSITGRFMSPDWSETPDPIPYGDLQNPQSLNLYGYVLNNPLTNTDPDGHKCDGGSLGPNGVFTIHCTTDPPKMDDGRVIPGDDGLGLIAGYGIGKLAGMGMQGLLALRGAGEAAGLMTETSSATINITEDGLEHVMERHVAGGAKTAGKSLFKGSKGEVRALIQKAESVKQTTQAGGNVERVVDAGRTIGTDRVTNAPTSVYTVITKPSGDLVTAFPGRP